MPIEDFIDASIDPIVVISKSKLTNIANALRNNLGTDIQYTLDEMVTAINTLGSNDRIPVTSIELSDITIEIGQTATIPRTFNPTNATNKNIIWQIADFPTPPSSNTTSTHISITSNGIATGLSVGQVNILATTVDGSHTDNCIVTVIKSGSGHVSA